MRRSAITSGNGRNAFISCVDSAAASGSAAMPRFIAASSSGVFRLNLVLLIVVYLPVICFSKADNPHGVVTGWERHEVQPAADNAKALVPILAVVTAGIGRNQQARPVKMNCIRQRDAVLLQVSGVFYAIECNFHPLIVDA